MRTVSLFTRTSLTEWVEGDFEQGAAEEETKMFLRGFFVVLSFVSLALVAHAAAVEVNRRTSRVYNA